MEFKILINEKKLMKIGDAKQINRTDQLKVGDNLKKLLKSLKLNKINVELFFNVLKTSIKSFYIINNDLMCGPNKGSIKSINFIIFLSKNNKIFNNLKNKNALINIKTNLDEKNNTDFFEMDRIDILHDIDEKFLKGNSYTKKDISFHFEPKSTTKIDSDIFKYDLFDKNKEVLIMKNLMKSEQNSGKLKLRWTYEFYRDYIEYQWIKYNNPKDKPDIFPNVLRVANNKNENSTEFICRIEKQSYNTDFIDITTLKQKKFIYFYNINDSDEKIKLSSTMTFTPFDYIKRVEKKIENNEAEISDLTLRIKDINEQINQLKNEVADLEKELQEADNKYIDLNNELKSIENEKSKCEEIISNLKSEISQIEANKKRSEDKSLENSKQKLNLEIKKVNENLHNFKNIIKNAQKDLKDADNYKKEQIKKLKSKNDILKQKQEEINISKKEQDSKCKEIKQLNKIIAKEDEIYEYYTFNIQNNLMTNLRTVNVVPIHLPEFRFVDFYNFSAKFDDNYGFILSDEDYGSFSKHKRFYNSLKNFVSGEYKNPLLAKSIEDPSFFKISKEELDNYDLNVNSKIMLNDKQKEAVKKAILTPCISYMQGPPGTGKTQTISAIIHHIISEKQQNVLLMSSTHEAILNAFDRIQELTETDPNFIFYKTIRKKEDNKLKTEKKSNSENDEDDSSNMYDLEHAFYRFATSIINFALNENKQNQLENIISKMSIINNEKNSDNFEKHKNIILFIETLDEYLKNAKYDKFKNKFEYWGEDKFIEMLSPFKNNYSTDEYENLKYSYEDLERETLYRQRELEIKEHINELKDVLLHNNSLRDIYKEIKDNNLKVKDINPKKINNKDKMVLLEKLDLIKTKIENFQDTHNNKIKAKFSDYIFDNELINLIGLTTTADQVISKKQNVESKKLFLQYPIYETIIDEVSKSSTLEIINSCMLSEKILLAGDYKQLPPVLDLETGSLTDEKIETQNFQKLLESFPEIKKLKDSKTENNNKDFSTKWFADENIRELIFELKYPFFKFHALKLKSKQQTLNEVNFYTFLTEQHRFNKKIQDVVNVFYDKDEKLTTPINKTGSFLLNYKYEDIKNKKEFIVQDTSIIDRSFLRELNNILSEENLSKIKENLYKAFDQNQKLFNDKNNNNNKTESTINDYNAFTISKIVENICINYWKENGQKFDLDKIGIISMTRSQNSVIRDWLKKLTTLRDKTINKIKIDTVDNFQGREKEIIIVDFVRAKGSFRDDKLIYMNKRNYDFYKSAERINVAVSRSKDTLILVGAFQELENIDFDISKWDDSVQKIVSIKRKILKEYINISKDSGTYRKAWDE